MWSSNLVGGRGIIERLTSHCKAINNGNTYYPVSNFATGELQQKILNKLGEYEDTGLTPEEVKSLQAELDQWKREAISDKAKLGEYKIAEGQGLLVKANNGDCGNCGLLSEFGGCSVFGYGKGTSEQCKAKFKELEGGASNE